MLASSSQGQEEPHTLDALILQQLEEEERAKSVVYLDERPKPPGRSIIGGQEYRYDAPYVVAFIDQRPGSNWMHPCRYLLIDQATGNVTSIKSDRPPAFGMLPPTWRVVWRSHGIDDWRLLPISRTSSQEP